MNISPSFPKSKWIDFLRHYGPIPRNDNMYDEVIQRTLKRKKVDPIIFDTEYLNELIENFQGSSPKSVILTGTAGDGKTFCCRKIWEALNGQSEDWEKDQKVYQLEIVNKQLFIVKDLSELEDELKTDLLTKMADSIVQPSSYIYLIAANDGQLIEAWNNAQDTPNVKEVRQVIEELLVTDTKEKSNYNLRLYNLSRLSAAQIIPKILDAVLNHSGWQECHQCYYYNPPNQNEKCPIWENKIRLEGTENNKTLQNRLIDLLELAELNGMHLPIRQLLLLIANILLGHPDGKDKLLNCRKIPAIVEQGTSHNASLYRNIFGENLSLRKRTSIEIFKVLNYFGVGTETSNQIDNILIFGSDDPNFKHDYDFLIETDTFYGAYRKFNLNQKSYLEGNYSEDRDNFLVMLQSQRQRLFFVIPPEQESSLDFWNLTVFQYAGEYLNDVYRVLKNNKQISQIIIGRLIRGLNRIFTGMLVKNQDRLIIATSGSYSQARISQVYEDEIFVRKKRGEKVTIELETNKNQPYLAVYLPSNQELSPIKLGLNLTRYEYLSRVAEGTLPSSFSQECYEDILAFKTQVLQQIEQRKIIEGEEEIDSENYMLLQLLEVKDEMANYVEVEIQI
ncbi:MAG: hypothetical protein AB4368_33220 [Xenococcaceae cyanobacterium]